MERIKENRMGTEPIGGLLVKMALPMMVSMTVLALYNVVDSIYVSRISEDALTAVSLAFPFQMLISAVAVGTGVGISSLVARRLGEKNQALADKTATCGIMLSLVSGIVFALLFTLLSERMLIMQSAEGDILTMSNTYLTICGLFAPVCCVQLATEKILQGTGKTTLSMIIQLTGAVFNIIFDPILIFGQYGFPEMGVAGAAAATVGGQTLGCIIGILMMYRKNRTVQVVFKGFKPDWGVVKDIYRVGLPSIIMQAIGSVTNFGLNKILIAFDTTAVSVLGVYFKLNSFSMMPVFALNGGCMPIMAYNYGARNKKRIMKALKMGILYAVCIMVAGTVIMHAIPDKLLSLFDASDKMMEIGCHAFRAISMSFPFVAVAIMIGALFQALGNGKLSLLISAFRQLIIILPAAYLLAKYAGLEAVWYSYPIAEVISMALSFTMLAAVYKKYIVPLPDDVPDTVKE